MNHKEIWWGRYGRLPISAVDLVEYDSMADKTKVDFRQGVILPMANVNDIGWRTGTYPYIKNSVLEGVGCSLLSTTAPTSEFYNVTVHFALASPTAAPFDGHSIYAMIRFTDSLPSSSRTTTFTSVAWNTSQGHRVNAQITCGQKRFLIYDYTTSSGAWYVNFTKTWNLYKWHSLAMVLNITDKSIKYYIDGVPMYTKTTDMVEIPSDGRTTFPYNPVRGIAMANMAVYRRPLSDTEIQQLDSILRPQ